MPKVGCSISDTDAKRLIDGYRSLNYAAARAITMFPYLKKFSLKEIKGKFSESELIVIRESLKDTDFSGDVITPDSLISKIRNSEIFEQTCSKNNIEVDELEEKLWTFTFAQIAFLIEEYTKG
jgi:hypothetical protein